MFGFQKRKKRRVTNEELQNELFAMGSVQQKQGEMLSRIALMQQKLLERADRGLEGLEKNDMSILEQLDKWGSRLTDLLNEKVAAVKPSDKDVTEAQVKREWFGEEDVV